MHRDRRGPKPPGADRRRAPRSGPPDQGHTELHFTASSRHIEKSIQAMAAHPDAVHRIREHLEAIFTGYFRAREPSEQVAAVMAVFFWAIFESRAYGDSMWLAARQLVEKVRQADRKPGVGP